MIIQVNTDNNIEGTEKLSAYVEATVKEGLNRFNNHITRIEVHLSDENGQKEGTIDKRCLIEVKLEGLKPLAVTDMDLTVHQAVEGAINKMKHALDSALGKIKTY